MSLNIAIIPARGGSKRLPGKNIKILAGKPLIAWTIAAAVESKLFDLVIVSTDSQEIADISIRYGAYVPFLRPQELSTDSATTSAVIEHAVCWVEANHETVSRVTVLQPTSPLRGVEDIKQAFSLYNNKDACSVISVCELEHPYQYCNQIHENLSMDGFILNANHKRTQELKPYYRLNGAIYIFNREYASDMSKIYSSQSYAYIMDKKNSIDIDDMYDFKMAEFFLQFEILDK